MTPIDSATSAAMICRRRDLDFIRPGSSEEKRRRRFGLSWQPRDYLLRKAARRSARLAAGACLPCAAARAAAMLGSSVSGVVGFRRAALALAASACSRARSAWACIACRETLTLDPLEL